MNVDAKEQRAIEKAIISKKFLVISFINHNVK